MLGSELRSYSVTGFRASPSVHFPLLSGYLGHHFGLLIRKLGLYLPHSVSHCLWLCLCPGPSSRRTGIGEKQTNKKAMGFCLSLLGPQLLQTKREVTSLSFRCLPPHCLHCLSPLSPLSLLSEIPGAEVWANREKKRRGSGDFFHCVSLWTSGVLSLHPVSPLNKSFSWALSVLGLMPVVEFQDALSPVQGILEKKKRKFLH